MPRIRCHYVDCVFLDDGYCSAAAVEVDPDMGCMTYSRAADAEVEDEWEDAEVDEDEEDLWIDDEEY